ncbi:MAG: DNA translocase FtsK 4TM domain-containing protein [Patescibacteria group bacterium]
MARRPKNKRKKDQAETESEKITALTPEARKGIIIVLLFAVAAISALSMFDLAGPAGKEIDKFLIYIFGYGKYIFPIILLVLGYVLIYPERYYVSFSNYLGIGVFLLSTLGMLNVIYQPNVGGGHIGMALSFPLLKLSTVWAALVVITALMITSLLLMFNTSLAVLLEKFPATSILGKIGRLIGSVFGRAKDGIIRRQLENYDSETDQEYNEFPEEQEGEVEEYDENNEATDFNKRELTSQEAEDRLEPEQMSLIKPKRQNRIIDIPIGLLNNKNDKPTSGDIKHNKEVIHHTLASFGIETELGEVSIGPTVTQYTLKPADGVKLSQITTLSNDLALALAAHPIRIEAPIPGKSLVGLEVPNETVAMVGVKEMLASDTFKKRTSNLALCVGRDVAGASYIMNLDSMPHLLIAGSTGSGKSVCINAIIMSLLFQNGPDDLKLILVDPKRVEFTLYNGIPHLLTPVITDVQKTINALKWAVGEMDRRYELLSKSGKRNIGDYNKNGSNMPYIVIVIDELADLMATAAREVEATITRLAQMARAVGIHLVLATQRPSVDVITGLIKANITSRIAFNVASIIDSRTILDHSGAEKLLGRGDMLFITASLGKPKRLQGALLTEDEIERVVKYLKSKAKPDYSGEVVEKQSRGIMPQAYQDGEDEDDLLEEAKDVILKAEKASASLLQRRLRVGYARAARILDILEEQGFIGPADGAKPREILVSTREDMNPNYAEQYTENHDYNEEEEEHVSDN